MIRTEENRQLQTNDMTTVVQFGFRDYRGRRVGAQIATWNAQMEPGLEDGKYGRSTLPPGPAFGLRCMATRNSVCFGAWQQEQWFATVEERDAAITRYLDGARKRAARNPDFRPD